MTNNTISKKIKTIGAILVFLMLSIIATTIYLNAKNKKDALIINIAGKERMLTQKISKNIFYLYHNGSRDFAELDNATEEFIYNLDSLKHGNTLRGISKVPTDNIANQIVKVEILWNNFYKNVQKIKSLLLEKQYLQSSSLDSFVNSIYKTNNKLLEEVDNLVSMYTAYSEEKTENIKYFQFISALLMLGLIAYSFFQLKSIESNAKKFFEFSKQLIQSDEPLKPMEFEAEGEIVEASNNINCFINKINTAMDYSALAIEQSKNASEKLEEITDEFDKVINELENNTDVSKHLNKTEDMVIESTEDLINSTKKLQDLKKELDKLLKHCKIKV